MKHAENSTKALWEMNRDNLVTCGLGMLSHATTPKANIYAKKTRCPGFTSDAVMQVESMGVHWLVLSSSSGRITSVPESPACPLCGKRLGAAKIIKLRPTAFKGKE